MIKIVELISIGDELLYGATVDTNAAYLARKLDAIGLDIRFKSTAPDNLEYLTEAISLALRRAHLVITTGGLGPTDDDITKKAICKVFKRNLVFHENIAEDLQKRFAARGIRMPAINQNQALLPQGARFLQNRNGSALGIMIEEQGRLFCSLPGVPSEMRLMTDEELIPYLAPLVKNQVTIRRRIRTVGIIESALAEKIRPALQFAEGVTLAYLPSYRGVDLAIKGIGTVEQEVRAGVDLLADAIRRMVPKYIYTEDNRDLEAVIGDLLLERSLTLAAAESCTGGLLSGRITRASGSSRYFLGGIVAYSNDIKMNQLDVEAGIIDAHGAVSEETAIAMADGIRNKTGASLGISVTGIAGPDGGTEEKPIGTVYVGLSYQDKAYARHFMMGRDREINRERSVTAALNLIRKELLGIE